MPLSEFLDKVTQGDCLDVLRRMPSDSVQCVVTSPPYWGLLLTIPEYGGMLHA